MCVKLRLCAENSRERGRKRNVGGGKMQLCMREMKIDCMGKVLTPKHNNHPYVIIEVLNQNNGCESVTMKNLKPLSGEASTRLWNLAAGICFGLEH